MTPLLFLLDEQPDLLADEARQYELDQIAAAQSEAATWPDNIDTPEDLG